MKRLATALCIQTALLSAASFVNDARACTPMLCAGTSPADGAVGVPTNAVILFPPEAGAIPTGTVIRGPADVKVEYDFENYHDSQPGSSINTFGVNILRPRQPLLPGTTYTVEFTSGAIVCVGQDGSHAAGTALSFTTGSSADIEPPAFAGATAASVTFMLAQEFGGGSCDSGPDRIRYVVTGEPVDDAVVYLAYRNGRIASGGWYPEISFYVEGSLSLDDIYPRECFVMRSMDQAGNIDENSVEVCAGGKGNDNGDDVQPHPSGAGGCSVVGVSAD